MVGISRLEKEILDFDESILHLEENIKQIEYLEEKNLENVHNILETFFTQYDHYSGLAKKLGLTLPLKKKHLNQKHYHSNLSLSILKHDLRSVSQVLRSYKGFIKEYLKGDENFLEVVHKNARNLSKTYDSCVKTLALMPYVVSGDRKYLFSMDTRLIKKHFNNNMKSLDLKCNIEGLKKIDSDIVYALWNMLRNSRDAYAQDNMNKRYRIDLRISKGKSIIDISVTDHGIGIPKSELPLIFSNFSKNSMTGYGVGLQLVKRIAELKEGYVDVISKHGRGSTYGYDTASGAVIRNNEIKYKNHGSRFALYFRE